MDSVEFESHPNGTILFSYIGNVRAEKGPDLDSGRNYSSSEY